MTKHKKHSSIIWLFSVAAIAVGLLLFCQFYFGDTISDNSTYYDGTVINGVDVSGMTKAEAENIITTEVLSSKDDISITLTHNKKSWKISGDDLSVVANLSPTLDSVMKYGHEGNIFDKSNTAKQIKQEGLNISIPASDIYGGIDNIVNQIVDEIECKQEDQKIIFSPHSQEMFKLNHDGCNIMVDVNLLKEQISEAIASQEEAIIEVPTHTTYPDKSLEDFVASISLRGVYCTDFSKSSADRKSNITLALSKFNGMIIEPNQTISFNDTTGARSEENGYKTAKIIVGGQYVSGMGGGVCQASTTLYNALLLSDIEIVKVFHHTLPASYVPLSFDAMVSEGYADLIFRNNLESPIFIKAYTTDNKACVEIYGQPFEDGLEIKQKAKLVKIIPHGGDDIITDKNGEYEDKVLYKGEYYRLKYPIEGYESQGFLQYYKNGVLTHEKQVRHDRYLPQNGIIIEGSYSPEEGMTIPSGNVKYIPPQKVTQQAIESAKTKWKVE